jgi:hypothetical protein
MKSVNRFMLVAALAVPFSGCAEGPEPNAVGTISSAVVQPDTTQLTPRSNHPNRKPTKCPNNLPRQNTTS